MFFDRIGADNAAIIYSSGSTGRPKGILISHRNLADGTDIVAEYLGTNEEDRICCVLSFNFDYGLNQIWQTIRKGATLYLHNLALPNDLFALLAAEKITALPVMPVIITKMFDKRLKLATGSYEFSSLRYVCSTGGRLSDDMLHDLKTTFPSAKIYSMFGSDRGVSLDVSGSLARLILIRLPSARPSPTAKYLVLDEKGDECPPNVVGELVHRGATVTKGYWRDPENTAKVFRSHPQVPGRNPGFQRRQGRDGTKKAISISSRGVTR